MKFLSFQFIVLMILAGLALPAAAQDVDLPESFTFDSGATFSFPEGGEVSVDEDSPDFISVEFDDAIIYVADFPVFEGRDFTTDSALVDAAEWYIVTISDEDFDADAAEVIELDGREALKYPYVYEENDWLLVMVRFEDGTFAAFDTAGIDEETALAVAASLGVAEVDTSGGAGCTVSATAEGTVQLRVGPGENRTSFAFLPANTEFVPLGQAEADDGSLWFQLDRAEVAPKSAAAEAWVAAEAVETSGDCDNLGAASAPPIVPIIPAAPPSSSGGGDSGGSSGGGQSSGGGGVVPSAGTWTITYASQGKGSCLDDASFTYEFGVDWGSDVVSLSFNGATMILGGNRFTQLQSGAYSGVFTLANGNSLQLILRPVSPTQFTGDAMLTGIVEGHTCSNTVPVTVTKN